VVAPRSAFAFWIRVLAVATFSTGTLAPAMPDEPAVLDPAAGTADDTGADGAATPDGSGAGAALRAGLSAGACSTTTFRSAADSMAVVER
jgi:hypothetical protein